MLFLEVYKIVFSTVLEAKSTDNLSVELGIPIRSIYRYIERLNKLVSCVRSYDKKYGIYRLI
jgi:hypothetical protein